MASGLVLAFVRETLAVGALTAGGGAFAGADGTTTPSLAAAGAEMNEWVTEPSLSKTSWRESETPAIVDTGTPKRGASTVAYSNRLDATVAVSSVMPKTKGEYTAWFEVLETAAYTGLSKAIDFSISASSDIGNGEGYHSIYDYANRAVFTVSGYRDDGEALYNFPLYVRIKKASPSGFAYTSLKRGKDEIRFFDSTGRSLVYEVAQWNESGESAFWVRVPTVRQGTEITMCWNLRDGCSLPVRGEAKEVWAGYVGVWHMDESITSATASTNLSYDATGNGLDMVPRCGSEGNLSKMTSVAGKFGSARVNDVQEPKSGSKPPYRANGNYLEIPNKDGLLDMGSVFTVSFWVKVDACQDWPKLVARRDNSDDTADGFQAEIVKVDNTSVLVWNQLFVRGNGASGCRLTATTKSFTNCDFLHMVYSYDGDKVSVYVDGDSRASEAPISPATDNGLPVALGNKNGGVDQSLWGKFDEVRLSRDAKSADWAAAEYAQGGTTFCTVGAMTEDASAVLKNEWKSTPAITKTTWEADETPPTRADFSLGEPYGAPSQGTQRLQFYDRSTGALLGEEVPTGAGDYRAVVTVAEVGGWGALEYTIDFRIVTHRTSHELGRNYDRILLMNDDYSVAGGDVAYQGYDDEDERIGLPFWRHLDENGEDASTSGAEYWSDSLLFNLGGGSHHAYYDGNTNRLWDLRDVRVGNTFNNGEILEETIGRWEADDEGLAANQNYLCWNPYSQRLVDGRSEIVDCWHRYAGQAVLQNSLDAAITSACYTNGIGTIYFDAVNGWTDNITNAAGAANYRLVVEIATNVVDVTGEIVNVTPDDARTDSVTAGGKLWRAAEYANWQPVSVRILRFDGAYCSDLGTHADLTLDIADGGNYECFYRVIVPVSASVPARFRIRRTAIDETQKFNPDGLAYILVDNVICSSPTRCVNLEPYGRFDAEKTGKRTLGCEGAFVPAFPSSQDASVRGRARARMSDGSPYAGTGLSSATLHYRWHYLEQKTTDWLLADLDIRNGLQTLQTLGVPACEGDIDFWFEANQNFPYYAYADYSGLVDGGGKPLGLGACGYTEEIAVVTNRATGADWFVRMREGLSDYAEARVFVKTPDGEPVREIDMTVSDNRSWRGFYRMTETFAKGIQWRIELRDRQDDGATAWIANTNCLYVKDWAETTPEFPAAGRLSGGTADDWSRMPCDQLTGYLMFQFDEQTLGVTVIHADYQDFNDWNDAGNGYFTGSSTEDGQKSGTSADVRTYDERYYRSPWKDEEPTDDRWPAIFDETPDYKPFASNEHDQWDLGEGMWVHEYYKDSSSRTGFQMKGDCHGYMEFQDRTQLLVEGWPRGLESVSFNARIAQQITPDSMAYMSGGDRLTNYTFMTRACFDLNKNRNFAGNAALSLFAYYRPGKGAYEARWEQISGEAEENPSYTGVMTGPKKRGQRLVISRWNRSSSGAGYQETVLNKVANDGVFNADMPLMPYNYSQLTNNLMPFCISVFKRTNGDTVITAAVYIKEDAENSTKKSGISWDAALPGDAKRWFFVCAVDPAATALKSGTYGVLSSNCEGLFLTPQYREGGTRPSDVTEAKLVKGYYTKKALNSVDGYLACYADIADDWWNMDPGREQPLFGRDASSAPYGFAHVALDQTVDVYTRPMGASGPTGDWTLRDMIPLSGFGKPGTSLGYTRHYYYVDDLALRLQAGGELGDYPVDVVIADVTMRQWRGRDDWSTSDRDWDFNEDRRKSSNDFGTTNVVFTCGWLTNGAVRLSAKRARPAKVTDNDAACSVRSPLFDGRQYGDHGEGLGKISIRYRKPSENIRLLVQVITNYTSASANLAKKSRVFEEGDGNKTWHTVARLTYRDLWSGNGSANADGTKTWSMSLGYHGAKGMMRVVIDNDLVEAIADETNPKWFGEIDIVEALFKDEPLLDKGCWWGWNLRTVGDPGDTERRMYLPDGASDAAGAGQSLALNQSVTDDVDPGVDADVFCKHMPFVQSPTFTNGIVGQLTFKARKFDLSDRSPDAKVVVYGIDENLPIEDWGRDDNWTFVAEFPVTNTVYTTYKYKTDGQKFKAMRLAVVDVPGTENPPSEPPRGAAAQRVLLDEVVVSEAVRAMLAFRNVGAFRTNLVDTVCAEGVPSAAQQPLCDENWGIQAEVFASMLEGEIDPTSEPKVKLHWYVGKDRWGYEKWKSVPVGTTDAKGSKIRGSAYLAPCEDSKYVYRSSYKTAPDAVLPAQSASDTVVQYMLEVEYQVINSATGKSSSATNWMDAASWSTPAWYAPIDYNADPAYGANKTFAGYTILDKIAPGWAWINEVNVYGKKDNMGRNTDKEFQYVELCVPAEADISGWQLRLLEYKSKTQVVTNRVAKFGSSPFDTAAGKKNGNKGLREGKVFRLIGNKESADLSKEDGTLDGVWAFDEITTLFRKDGSTYYIHYMDTPFGVQLLRPSGIIESSVVGIGTNELGTLWSSYDPSYVASEFNRLVPGSKFFYAAEDCCGVKRTGSVMRGQGDSPSVWTNNWVATPGNINRSVDGTEQIIGQHPTPLGDSVIVYASVDTTFGRITQYVGGKGSALTNTSEMIILRRGGPGTNIVYRVDPWFELKGVTTNGVSAWAYAPHVREQSVLVGAGASNNVTVVASAQVDSKLREYGLTEDNPYTPAVMDWLVNGKTMNPNMTDKGFRNPGEIALAEFMDLKDRVVTNLTLTQMYWLDMDPTVSNLVLKGGFSQQPTVEPRGELENIKVTVFLAVSNKIDHTAWSPYVLRGLDPNYTSWQYDDASVVAQSWTSETFKVTGILANGLTSRFNVNNWIPLRWFVFHKDSFYQPSDEPAHPRFTTDIEIIDPHSSMSAGADAGWYEWFQEHGRDSANVLHWWWIDDRKKPVAPLVLKPENFYK